MPRPETYQTPSSVWTDARVERLTELWNARTHSCKEIADKLNCGLTRNAVIGKVTRLGLESHGFHSVFRAVKPKKPRARRTIRKNGAGYVPLVPEDEPIATDLNSLQEVEAQPKPNNFLGIPLLKLEPEHCRYPRDVNGVTLFCGQPKFVRVLSDGNVHHSSYCRECHHRCHTGSFGTKHSTFVFGRRVA